MHCCQSWKRLNYLFRIQILNHSHTHSVAIYPSKLCRTSELEWDDIVALIHTHTSIAISANFNERLHIFTLQPKKQRTQIEWWYKIHSLVVFFVFFSCCTQRRHWQFAIKTSRRKSCGSFEVVNHICRLQMAFEYDENYRYRMRNCGKVSLGNKNTGKWSCIHEIVRKFKYFHVKCSTDKQNI